MATKYKAIKVDGIKHDEHRYLMEQHVGRKLNSTITLEIIGLRI